MPETKAPEALHPSTVGSTFMRQYYHFLAKEPESLHRFYKDESLWCHGVGSHMQEPISGQKAINDEILRRGYAGARVDLDIGSIDCQGSLNGGVFVLVTGIMTLASSPVPKPFVQTFFLAVQPKGYFVLNDCLRFLELPGVAGSAPSASDAAVAPKDVKKPTAQAAIGTPVPSPAPKATAKPVTPVAAAKKEKTPASPVAKPVETPASPVKVKSPAKVASPKAAATPAPVPAAPASPAKKTAPATEKAATPKPSETKPATPASPAAAPAKPATPASPAPAKPAAPAQPVVPKPAEPAAPKTWAALFNASPAPSAPATPAAPAPKPAASSAPKATPASPKAKPAESAAVQQKEKPRYFSLFIRDVPPQTKDTEIRELFKSFGAIANVTVPSGKGVAYVDYVDEASMRAALADGQEFKVHDKVLQVDERAERKDKHNNSGFRDARGGRGGRGPGPKNAGRGDRKERDDGKERRPAADRENTNGRVNTAPRSTTDRRDKGGRRGGKEDGGRGANANRTD